MSDEFETTEERDRTEADLLDWLDRTKIQTADGKTPKFPLEADDTPDPQGDRD
jgi:hypothetical protein